MADDFTALRDHFAEVAMCELLQKAPPTPTHLPATVWAPPLAATSYAIADAMIEARNKK